MFGNIKQPITKPSYILIHVFATMQAFLKNIDAHQKLLDMGDYAGKTVLIRKAGR